MLNSKILRSIGISLLLLLCVQQLSSQSTDNVVRHVLDSVTREAIPYAHLYIKETSKLFLSNEKGIYPPINLREGKLVVSSMGYNTKEIDLSSSHPKEILLSPSVTTLGQVEILGLSASSLLSKAINQIPENYPPLPFLSTYYYRAQAVDTAKDKALYVEECIFQQVKQYTKGYKPTIRLIRNRNYRLSDERVRVSGIGLQDYVLNLISTPVRSQLKYGRRIRNNEGCLIELSINDAKKKTSGSIYIDSASHAIVKLDIANKDLHHIAEYKRLKTKYYLSRLQTTNSKNKKIAFKSDIVLDNIQEDFNQANLKGIEVESWESMEPYKDFEAHAGDSSLWQKHEVLLPDSKLSEEITQGAKTLRTSTKTKPIVEQDPFLPVPAIYLSASSYGLHKESIADMSISVGSLSPLLTSKVFKHPFLGLLTGMFTSAYLLSPIEETLLEKRHLQSLGITAKGIYHPFNRYGEGYIKVTTEAMARLQRSNYQDFMHTHTLRNEYHYTKSRMIEEMLMKANLDYSQNYNKHVTHLLGQLLVSKFYNIHFKKKDEINFLPEDITSGPVSANRENSWVKYLFEPEAKFSHQIRKDDLSSEQRTYLKNSSLRSWINLLSPALLALNHLRLSPNWKASASIGYLRIPFGEQFEESFWLLNRGTLHNISLKQFLSHFAVGFGLGYKLYDYRLSPKLKLTTHIEGWLQQRSFFGKKLHPGGKISQDLIYNLSLYNSSSLSLFAGYEWKSYGFSHDNTRLTPAIDIKLGVSYRL